MQKWCPEQIVEALRPIDAERLSQGIPVVIASFRLLEKRKA